MIGTHRSKFQVPLWLCTATIVAVVGMMALGQAPAPAPGNAPGNAAGNAADAGADAESGEVVLEQQKMNFLELLAKGRWFMLPIGLCSLIGLALIIERLIALRRGQIIPRGFMDGLRGVFHNPRTDRAAALQYCHSNRSPISRVIAVGIRKLPQGEEAVEQGIEDAGANEVAKLKRNLRMLYGISAIAPMLGLLGTVWGMIEAFQEAARGGLGKAEGLAAGIYEALVTTFAGLCVAIPILMFYYYFISKIDRLISDLNDVSEEFVESYIADDEVTAAAGGQARPSSPPPMPGSGQPAVAPS